MMMMSDNAPTTVTALLERYTSGDTSALHSLMPLVYQELKRIASRQLRKSNQHTLDTTGLVNDAYCKIAARTSMPVKSRAHFFAISAQAMRQLLVDHLRRRAAQKRGDGSAALPLAEVDGADPGQGDIWLRVDDALRIMQEHDERLVKILECRVFAGYSNQETAHILGLSTRTVQREWLRAKAWISKSLEH